ncbi:MAG: hypothetical protein HYZ42_16225, partial [Bacteroidetes bacterium]|nr:hypothetical protein [Bacteroidota bacterium]
PVALITASSLGEKGHQSLLDTLKIIESDIPESSQLLISYIKTKLKDGQIIDIETLKQIEELIHSLIHSISTKKEKNI